MDKHDYKLSNNETKYNNEDELRECPICNNLYMKKESIYCSRICEQILYCLEINYNIVVNKQ